MEQKKHASALSSSSPSSLPALPSCPEIMPQIKAKVINTSCIIFCAILIVEKKVQTEHADAVVMAVGVLSDWQAVRGHVFGKSSRPPTAMQASRQPFHAPLINISPTPDQSPPLPNAAAHTSALLAAA